MANNYTKLTKETFKERLKDGIYADAVAAKRGLGRAALSAAAKKVCLEAIEKHKFKGKKAAKTSKKKVAAKAKTRKLATKKVASRKKSKATKRKPVTIDIGSTAHLSTPVREPVTPAMQEKFDRINLAREQIGTTAQAIAAMKLAKEVNPKLDVIEGSESSQRILTHAVKSLDSTLTTPTGDNGTSTVLGSAPPYSAGATETSEEPVEMPSDEDVANADPGE